MPAQTRSSQSAPRRRISDLEHLETVVESLANTTANFTNAAQKLIESDHEKVELIYKFLFLGEPGSSPPVPPFVISMQKNGDDIDSFKNSFSKFAWIVISILVTGIVSFIFAIYNKLILFSALVK